MHSAQTTNRKHEIFSAAYAVDFGIATDIALSNLKTNPNSLECPPKKGNTSLQKPQTVFLERAFTTKC